jgi:hypothetical protein
LKIVKTDIVGIKPQPSHNGSLNGGPGNDIRVTQDLAAASINGADKTQIYSSVVERYAMFFDRPEARLRFLNNTLTKQVARQDRLKRRFSRSRILGRTRIYDWLLEARCYSAIFEEMRAMYSSLPKERRKLTRGIQAPFSARLLFLLHQSRHAFYGAAVIMMLMAFAGLYTVGAWSARGVNDYLVKKYNKPGALPPAPSPTPNPNNNLFGDPEKIFLAETDNGVEKWSNGCNISTKYETDNHPRSYYAIPRGGDIDSAMLDFNVENSKAIQKGSRGLIEYVRDHKKYNYMINRIGDIYRIVKDDQAAIHAGDSLWADDKNTYVLLNESFIGVCFESKFEGASSLNEILTPSQIRAGRMLTDVLRTRYGIDDANCTTHGLVAVDPEKMLIARHHDWVRFFPFERMGLSDKYKIQPPTMTDYGFTYDADVMAKLGNLWEGAATAEETFKRRAEQAGVSPDVLRSKMRDHYVSQCNKTFGLHAEQGDVKGSKKSADGESTVSGADQSTSDAWKALRK